MKVALLCFADENGIAITEAELAQVAGGGVPDAMFSIFTLGLGCAVNSLVTTRKNVRTCSVVQKDDQG